MPTKHLMAPTGMVDAIPQPGDLMDMIVRPVILIHSGPNGSNIDLESSSGPLSFDDSRVRAIVEINNTRKMELGNQYGGLEKMPIGAFPPFLDVHEDDSSDCILGRLNHQLWVEVRDVPKVGANVTCAMTYVSVLGSENVKKVCDGRIYHVSVGIGDDPDGDHYNVITETSAVNEPAAPGAMFLKKPKTPTKGEAMPNKQLKKLKSLQRKRVKKLKAAHEEMKSLSSKITAASNGVKFAKKETAVRMQLSKLMKGGKLTPAEFKKLSVKKLAALPEEAMNILMDSFEALEPKIDPIQYGSSAAIEVANIAKNLEKSQYKTLKAETRAQFKKLGAKFKAGSEEDEAKMAADDKNGEDKDKELNGGIDENQKALESMKDSVPQVSEEEGTAIAEMQKQVDELNTQIGRMAGIIEELMKSETEEEAALSEHVEEDAELDDGEEEDEEMAAGEGEDKDKKLGADPEDKDKDKNLESDKGDKDKDLEAGSDGEKDKDKGKKPGKE